MAVTGIYLIGFMGAGKSTVGRRLAKKLGWKFVDLDEEIERSEHRAIADIFRELGEPRFREIEHRCLERIAVSTKTVVALGGGAFITPGNRELAEKTGLTVWLKVSFENIARRVKIDGTRPNFASMEKAEALYRTREPFYALAKAHVSTDDRTPEAIADEIIKVIGES